MAETGLPYGSGKTIANVPYLPAWVIPGESGVYRASEWKAFTITKGVNAVMSHCSPDILLFDLAPPLPFVGGDACRKNWKEWFATWGSRLAMRFRELSITVGPDVPYRHSLNLISRKRTSGTEIAEGYHQNGSLAAQHGPQAGDHEIHSLSDLGPALDIR